MEVTGVRVVTLTVNPALDVAVTVEAMVPEHKMHAVASRRDPGGGGVNVSRALRRLGVASEALIVAGGPIGDELVALVEAEGVAVSRIANPHMTRESIAVRDASRGTQYRVVVDGPPVADVDALLDAVVTAARGASVLVVSGNLSPTTPPRLYRDLLAAVDADSPGMTTVVDCAGQALAEAVRSAATIVKPSRRELASLVDWTPATSGELVVAAREVLGRGAVEALAVSLGARGAVLVERDGPATWFAPPAVDVVSTVGSGDTMVAALVAALLDGSDLVDAVRRGVAAGTAACLTDGTDLCHVADVERLLPLVRMETDTGRIR
ncbi:MAG: hexose kinase [Acidimicrobiales bacterium]